MVKGLDIFRDHFRQFEGFFTLIGGAACVEWFDAEQLEFWTGRWAIFRSRIRSVKTSKIHG